MFCEVIDAVGVNGQLPWRGERDERELKLTLALPSSVGAGVGQG